MIANAEEVYLSGFNAGLTPDQDYNLLDYVTEHGVLSSKGSPEAGRYDPDRTPHVKEIYQELSPESPYNIVVHMKGTQLGATEIDNQWFNYIVDVAPGPMQMIFPNSDAREDHSKLKLTPMIEDNERIRDKISQPKAKESSNTIAKKEFLGGFLILSTANTGVTYRHKSIKYLILDDIDGFPLEIKGEGVPDALAINRTDAFGSKKKIYINGTPTLKDVSFIEKWYNKSDQRQYYIPCPLCNHKQVLIFDNMKFERDDDYFLVDHVKYKCEKCKKLFGEHYKTDMLLAGEWIKKFPKRKIAGFLTPSFYSPLGWLSWDDIAEQFLEAKQKRDRGLLQIVFNTRFAMVWEESGDKVSEVPLMNRREKYGPEIPMAAGVLTCAVDCQGDRLEAEVVAWGKGEESWSIDYKIFYGNTNTVESLVWKDLDAYLLSKWKHESGVYLRIVCTAIDSSDNTKVVYKFVKSRQGRRVYAIKGKGGVGMPLVNRPTKNNSLKVSLFTIGTDTAKDLLFSRLRLDDYGPGYCHFPIDREKEYFKQLTAEKKTPTHVKGRITGYKYINIRTRNEALDIRVYNMAALDILSPNLDLLVDRLQMVEAEEENEHKPEPTKKTRNGINQKPHNRHRNGKGFVNRW